MDPFAYVISVTARKEILWWVENTHSRFRNIDHGKYGGFLTTDASKEGWGGACTLHYQMTKVLILTGIRKQE